MPAKSKRKTTSEHPHPVDVVIDRTISEHAEQAKVDKEQNERIRLAPRRRMAKAIMAVIERELAAKTSTGLPVSRAKIADISEECAKQMAKKLGLEPVGNKKKET